MRSQLFCVTVGLAVLAGPAMSSAAPVCPAEVKEARELLAAKAAAAQRPRSQAGARGQATQAPREQEIQAPRSQETQAPRGQEDQAPRNAAKGRAAALANARKLMSEAEAACKDADSARATSNARAAIELLKYLP
jgi:hypothetical protein